MINTNTLSLLSVLNRRKWLAAATFSSVIAGAVAYLILVPPQYKVKTKLMLNEQQTGVSELGKDLQGSTYQAGQSSPLATIAELVKSKKVMEQSIDQVVSNHSESSETPSSSNDLETTVHPKKIETTPSPQETQFSLLKKGLKKNLNVKIVPSTNILELNYQHEDPELAAQLLNSITENLVAENVKAIRSQATAVREFLEKEIPQQRKIAEASAQVENNYRRQNNLIAEGEQTSNLVSSIESLATQERTLIAELQKNERATQELQKLIGLSDTKKALVTGQIAEDQTLQTLQTKLADLDTAIAEARSRFTDANPTVISLLEERAQTESRYQKELRKIDPNSRINSISKITTDSLTQNLTNQLILNKIEGSALRDQLNVLTVQKQQLESRLNQVPSQQQILSQLVRKREKAFETLKFLEGKLEEAQLTEAQLLSNLTVLELAEVNLSDQTPSKKVILVLAGFVGIILATGMVLLTETLDNTLYKDFDIEQAFKTPVIEDLPALPEMSLLGNNYNFFLDEQALVEPYRRLLKSLESGHSEQSKLLVVSSAVSGEGKSIVASHLGAVSGMLFRRTLIIDANLRNPQQEDLFSLKASLGLTDISNAPVSLKDLVQPTQIENLSILPGGIPLKQFKSRPSLILESPVLKSLLQEAKQHYELIIIDTAALDNCSDAITLGELSDGVILVTRPNFTSKDKLEKSIENILKNRVSLKGIVMNNVPKKQTIFKKFNH